MHVGSATPVLGGVTDAFGSNMSLRWRTSSVETLNAKYDRSTLDISSWDGKVSEVWMDDGLQFPNVSQLYFTESYHTSSCWRFANVTNLVFHTLVCERTGKGTNSIGFIGFGALVRLT